MYIKKKHIAKEKRAGNQFGLSKACHIIYKNSNLNDAYIINNTKKENIFSFLFTLLLQKYPIDSIIIIIPQYKLGVPNVLRVSNEPINTLLSISPNS